MPIMDVPGAWLVAKFIVGALEEDFCRETLPFVMLSSNASTFVSDAANIIGTVAVSFLSKAPIVHWSPIPTLPKASA